MVDLAALRYRWAEPRDAALWSDFVAEQQRVTYGFARDFAESRRAERHQRAAELLADGDYHCLLAFADDDLVGMTAIRRGPSRWEIDEDLLPLPTEYGLDKLYLAPQYHGSGLALDLFKRISTMLFGEAGQCPALYLWLVNGNDRAARFYEKLGFGHLDEVYDCGPDWDGKTMHRMLRPAAE